MLCQLIFQSLDCLLLNSKQLLDDPLLLLNQVASRLDIFAPLQNLLQLFIGRRLPLPIDHNFLLLSLQCPYPLIPRLELHFQLSGLLLKLLLQIT